MSKNGCYGEYNFGISALVVPLTLHTAFIWACQIWQTNVLSPNFNSSNIFHYTVCICTFCINFCTFCPDKVTTLMTSDVRHTATTLASAALTQSVVSTLASAALTPSVVSTLASAALSLTPSVVSTLGSAALTPSTVSVHSQSESWVYYTVIAALGAVIVIITMLAATALLLLIKLRRCNKGW